MTSIKLPDLDTRNILNVVMENMERLGRKAYGTRIVYIGEHTLKKEEIIKKIEKSVHYVNIGYTDIPVHGILLVYDSYFVHIIQGSENTIFRQLRFLFNIEKNWIEKMNRLDEEAAAVAAEAAALAAEEEGITLVVEEHEVEKIERKMFKRLKMLIVHHSLSNLSFTNWRAIVARPPSLVGKLDVFGPQSEHMEQLRVCLDKLSKLCDLSKQFENLSFEGLSANDPKMEALPEVALLDYLLQSQYVMELREVASMHRRVDDYIFYFESIWPLPSACTPRHLYKLKIDDSFVEQLPVMPWELKKDEEEEVKEDAQSKSSSSSD